MLGCTDKALSCTSLNETCQWRSTQFCCSQFEAATRGRETGVRQRLKTPKHMRLFQEARRMPHAHVFMFFRRRKTEAMHTWRVAFFLMPTKPTNAQSLSRWTCQSFIMGLCKLTKISLLQSSQRLPKLWPCSHVPQLLVGILIRTSSTSAKQAKSSQAAKLLSKFKLPLTELRPPRRVSRAGQA